MIQPWPFGQGCFLLGLFLGGQSGFLGFFVFFLFFFEFFCFFFWNKKVSIFTG